ncbi:MAG TPA: hypothetical protein VKV39_06220 [Candidatus Sulfotelmatobacter sp.]|nr:hypothetical protein [Candidatus Sulfotelmatobacter sp.]
MKESVRPAWPRPIVVFCLALAMLLNVPLSAQSTTPAETFADRIAKFHYPIEVKDGHLTGSGAPVLASAFEGAQFILLGEDHGIAQIPQFDAAVCGLVGPKGFRDLAIEVGPSVAEKLSEALAEKDGRTNMVAFNKDFPETVAFYNWAEEYDFLAHCSQAATGGKFRLWGMDQELMGASGYLLTQILKQRLSPTAAAEARHLIEENDAAHAQAAKSGNPFELFMMSAPDAELAHFRETLVHEGNPAFPKMLDGLLESREIYKKYQDGRGFESNRQRALMMKRIFTFNYDLESDEDSSPPKVIMKFGGEHLFKGFNPLHNNDVGNLIAELADPQHSKSVHILLLGVKGKQARFAGIGKPAEATDFNLAEDKDSDFLFLKPFFEKTANDGMTMFDLRAFRQGFSSLGPVDREMERLVFGYDFLVLIPNATASGLLQ